MNFKRTYVSQNGYTPICKAGESTLKDLEFGIIELAPDQKLDFDTENKETAFVILFGTVAFSANGREYGKVGVRSNVFASPKAECFYAPRNCHVQLTSVYNCKIAVCATPIDVDTEPQVIHQSDVRVVRLGVKPWERDTSFIIDGNTNAKKLTIGEAYVTPGNWAGFPPHKHDVDNMPAECVAEEVYYFLFEPSQGFGDAAVYTASGSIDEMLIG